MTSPFGGFVHTSPLSSLPHDPFVTHGSNCIRDYFGPTAQTVADGLHRRGGSSTLAQVIAFVRQHCRRVWNEERERLVGRLIQSESSLDYKYKIHRAKGPEHAGFVVEAAPIRAALLTLVQHSLVKVEKAPGNSSSSNSNSGGGGGGGEGKKRNRGSANEIKYQYTFDPDRARLLPRYTRYVEYAKKALNEHAAGVIEELLTDGRMNTYDAILATIDTLTQAADKESEVNLEDVRKGVVQSFMRLAQNGFIQLAPPLTTTDNDNDNDDDDDNDGDDNGNGVKEEEFEASAPASKKRKTTTGEALAVADAADTTAPDNNNSDDEPVPDAEILALLDSNHFHRHFPKNAVWRVNVNMFHDHLRAFCLGRLVAERFGHKVQSAGSIVSAALKFSAHCDHVLKQSENIEEKGNFTPEDIVAYLPGPVRESFEKKRGGAVSNLSKALVELAQFTWPTIVMEVEEALGHPKGGKFELATRQLVLHLRSRIIHKMILDSQGEVAARVCSILESKGHQESDAVAEAAMAPVKDVREVLHRLYRSNYISLLNLQQSKQHNPANAIYLWAVDKARMSQAVTDHVCSALFNIRLRRQHEMEMGKDYIDRAKEAEGTDENIHELDQLNYGKFKQGLERLDIAALQLDETLMVLKDF